MKRKRATAVDLFDNSSPSSSWGLSPRSKRPRLQPQLPNQLPRIRLKTGATSKRKNRRTPKRRPSRSQAIEMPAKALPRSPTCMGAPTRYQENRDSDAFATTFEVEKIPYESDIETLGPMKLADALKTITERKYIELTRNNNSTKNIRKVLASVVIERKISTYKSRLCIVSLGAGSRTIKGKNLTKYGNRVHDCHAEILARRGLVRFLYSQLEEIKNGNHEMSVFERTESRKYSLKSNVSFHLFISKPPCGDASVFGFHENHKNRKSRGIARVIPEDGEGGVRISWRPYQDKTFRDFVYRRARLHKMCCSAKIARWNVIGVQGALLSLLIKPVYFSSISIGSRFNTRHLRRAVHGRIRNIHGLPVGYRVNNPNLNYVSNPDNVSVKRSSHKFSLNWYLHAKTRGRKRITRNKGEELIECQLGKPPNASYSRLCKKELFVCFNSLCESLASRSTKQELEMCLQSSQQQYCTVKAFAKEYQEAKAKVDQCFSRKPCGSRWLKMPQEVDQFFIDT